MYESYTSDNLFDLSFVLCIFIYGVSGVANEEAPIEKQRWQLGHLHINVETSEKVLKI